MRGRPAPLSLSLLLYIALLLLALKTCLTKMSSVSYNSTKKPQGNQIEIQPTHNKTFLSTFTYFPQNSK